ncbi:MAG TPA: DNA polymerase III subunit delta' C-terminal domain-containing protein [Longimicrobiales bacterium]|nr:DNA polymerase III subunit delta' C-terminal domain-containing protein [Longimicrobiales bacterium]
MSLTPIEGHQDVRRALARASAARQLPNSLLLHGPAGIGKQRVALWLAQLLLCARPAGDEPCGTCQSCRMVDRLEHPDMHWYFPLPRPKAAGGPDRLGEALEEARAAELAARRTEPLRATVPDGLSGIYLAHIHSLLRTAAARPAMGARKVFIVGDAEALVPQEASPEAANALLKLLEEPPADTTVILTASDPDVLLPTVRSRLLPVRLRPLGTDRVERYLREHARADATQARQAAQLAQGSIGRAVAYLPQQGAPGPLEDIRLAARALLEAALDRSAAPRLTASLNESPAGARGLFSDTLAALTSWLRDLAAAATGADEVIVNVDAADWLRTLAQRHPRAAQGVPAAIRDVDATIQLTQLNINPQLALAGLLRSIHRRIA